MAVEDTTDLFGLNSSYHCQRIRPLTPSLASGHETRIGRSPREIAVRYDPSTDRVHGAGQTVRCRRHAVRTDAYLGGNLTAREMDVERLCGQQPGTPLGALRAEDNVLILTLPSVVA